MKILSSSSCVWLVGLLCSCGDADKVAPAGGSRSGGQAFGSQRAAGQVVDAPIEPFRRGLLELAFDAASKFPSRPHTKNRGRAQDLAVAMCFELEQPKLALGMAPRVEGWHRGIAYADYAWCAAKAGNEAAVRSHIKLAEGVVDSLRSNPNGQQWRADKVHVKVARALATLGQHDQAKQMLAKVATESAGAVDDDWALTMSSRIDKMEIADARRELDGITATFLNQSLGDQFTSLMLISGMHGRFFADEGLRKEFEERLFERFEKLPTKLRLDAMAPLVGHYVEHKDVPGSLEVIRKMSELMAKFSWRTEERLPQLARFAELRVLSGDVARARVELERAMVDYHESRDELIDIYRCETLRPVALAYHALGDRQRANDLLALALEEGMHNPNSRPRCDDLVETCVAMAKAAVEPSADLWQRMREIEQGLSAPW